jgi:cyclopropane fatty-acyl-phospholipid synthase-like methyltransferase
MSENHVFDSYSHYYDLLYNDKNYVAEVNYIDALLKEHGLSGNKLLEFGSGTGKHGRLLAERGYDITGIELSESMVQKAKQSEGFKSQQGDIRKVNLGRNFDAVIALFHVVSYQTLIEDVVSVFQRATEHLESGGIFVFDVWYSPAVYNLKPETRVKHIANDMVEVTRIAEPTIFTNENRVDVNYTVFVKSKVENNFQSFSETHPMRHFSITEIDLVASQIGFERIIAEEFLTGNEPGEETWGVCFVLKKS